MKTPFDTIVRIETRRVEEIRLAVHGEMAQVRQWAEAEQAVAHAMRAECESAASDPMLSTHAWLRARMADAATAARHRSASETALAQLRDKASNAYGALRVAQEAARRHREHIARQRSRFEQAEADDLSQARRLLRERRAAMTARWGGPA
ncbi:hypothetical protein [Sphingobium subterraneum]|uniref:Flagellar FliJ protein n=1 Tax=Sphingobium subterraneum TaxID=627688 RepID=A0A841IYV0_9SPHN|nr:hypothetical protein [Sphingobium subterraneum]MBB6124129.1 hypothetical protein [Sphingobium subterraneum]